MENLQTEIIDLELELNVKEIKIQREEIRIKCLIRSKYNFELCFETYFIVKFSRTLSIGDGKEIIKN